MVRRTIALFVVSLVAACGRETASAPAAPEPAVAKPDPQDPPAAAKPDLAAKPDIVAKADPVAKPGAPPDAEDKPPRARLSNAADEAGLDATITEFAGSKVTKTETFWPGGQKQRISFTEIGPRERPVDHGPDWRWYENGQLQLKRTWKHGKQDGPFAEWHESGFQQATGAFSEDQKDGPWLTWFEDGSIRGESTWTKGKLQGREREWFPVGSLRSETFWKDGKQDGPIRNWFAFSLMRSASLRPTPPAGRRVAGKTVGRKGPRNGRGGPPACPRR